MDELEWYYQLIEFGLTYDKEELLQNAKGVKVIRVGNFTYNCFNICFLHDMLSQILQVLFEGDIPEVAVEIGGENLYSGRGSNIWELFFEQPFFDMDKKRLADLPRKETSCRISTVWGPEYEDFRNNQYEYELTCRLYRDFAVIREDVFRHIAKEYKDIIWGKSVLGVLCRGTDFTCHPAGHPVQPKLSDIIEETGNMMDRHGCEYVYVATEEERIMEQFKKAYGSRVLENSRHYFDSEFYSKVADRNGEMLYISEVIYQREKDVFQNGIEYLSSLVLLSRCKALLAGDCGGSEAALYFNDHEYEDFYIYYPSFCERHQCVMKQLHRLFAI